MLDARWTVVFRSISWVRRSTSRESLALKEGVKRHAIEGFEVPIFEPAKTIVDGFPHRNKIGLDIVLEGLREGMRTN